MKEDIRVLIVEPYKLPYEKVINNTLEEKQKIVDGYIEYVVLDDDVLLICNEEAKILGLPLNRRIDHDIIAGTFIVAGDNYKTGEDASLTDEQIKKYSKYFDEKSIEETQFEIFKMRLKNQELNL